MILNNEKVEEYISNKKEFIEELKRCHTKTMQDLARECGNLADIELNTGVYDILVNTVNSLEKNRKLLKTCEEELEQLSLFLNKTKQPVESDKQIVVECYGKIQTFETREQAMAFYTKCFHSSEGAERDRYIRILEELHSGLYHCSDIPMKEII